MKCRAGARDEKKVAISRKRAQASRRARVQGARVEYVNFERVAKRDRLRCHICKRKVRLAELNFDHVIPLAKGGAHCEANLAVAHRRCNFQKHDKVLALF